MIFRRNLPDLLDAQPVGLRRSALVQAVSLDQTFSEIAATAFGKQCISPQQFHARLEIRARRAIVQTAEIAGCDAFDGTLFVEKDVGRGKTGKNIYAQCLGLPRQPAAKIAERNDVIASLTKTGG